MTKFNTEMIKTFDTNVFLDFIAGVKKEIAAQIPFCPVSPREDDSSIYSMPDDIQLLFSVSN